LAILYVCARRQATKRFNEQVKRNSERFPSDFMFQLTEEEFSALRSQFATSNGSRGGRRYPPFAFTEHGAVMAANVINSAHAIQVSIFVVRAFVQMREMAVSNKELALRLDALEDKWELLSLKHGTLEHNTRVQLKQIFDALRELMAQPEPAPKRPIGFVTPDSMPGKTNAAKRRAIKSGK